MAHTLNKLNRDSIPHSNDAATSPNYSEVQQYATTRISLKFTYSVREYIQPTSHFQKNEAPR